MFLPEEHELTVDNSTKMKKGQNMCVPNIKNSGVLEIISDSNRRGWVAVSLSLVLSLVLSLALSDDQGPFLDTVVHI